MRRLSNRKLILFLLCIALIAACSVTAAATNGSKKVELFYRDIKIMLNGNTITPKDANGNVVEPFIIDGTTYLPVRAVSEALGLNVGWDGETQTVKLTEKGYAEGGNYGRLNPAPVGTAQTFAYSSYSETYSATVVINSVERGTAAWQKIKAANQFNDEPDAGMEYILANISITLLSSEDDAAVSFSDYSFDVYSSDSAEYEDAYVVVPTPELRGKIFPGGTLTGYVVFQVNVDDAAPKVVIGDDYNGKGGAWFSLTK